MCNGPPYPNLAYLMFLFISFWCTGMGVWHGRVLGFRSAGDLVVVMLILVIVVVRDFDVRMSGF